MPSPLKLLLTFIATSFLFNALPVHAQQQQNQMQPGQTQAAEPGQTICAGNIPPEGTIITATGNSVDCGGSCRARQIEPLRGHIMVICAQQPIPDEYEIQSVTSTPACNCLGEDDNAYVIRAITGALTNPGAAHSQAGGGSSAGSGGSFGGH